MNRQEVYEACVYALTDRFEESEFEKREFTVKCNPAMGTITIVENATGQVMSLLDVSGASFTGGRSSDDPILVRLPTSAKTGIGISDWVAPASDGYANDSETIVGRVVHIPPDPTEVRVAWLSNVRGLWLNYESVDDLVAIERPQIGSIEALMVMAEPTTPAGYEP